MTKKNGTRRDHEQGMLDNIGGDGGEPSQKPVAPSAPVPVGWMGYVGGALWTTIFGVVGLIAWLVFAGGA